MKSTIKQLFLTAATAAVLASCGKQEAPNGSAASASAAPAGTVAGVPVQAGYVVPDGAVEAGKCSLDAINGVATAGASAASGSDVLFGGWAADPDNQVPADALLVFKGAAGSYSVPLVAGGERPDVATAFGNEALKTSGYNVTATLAGVTPGSYELQIAFAGGSPKFCSLKTSLVVN